MIAAGPYGAPVEHLRDEVRRVWLRLEHAVRERWEAGVLPRVSDEAGLGIRGPDQVDGLFRAADAEYCGLAEPAIVDAGAEAFATEALVEWERIEGRIEASLEAGMRLPLVELARRFQLSPLQARVLTVALALDADPGLLVALRYLAHDPSCRALDLRLLALLVGDDLSTRVQLAQDLAPGSPLVGRRLLEIDERTGAVRAAPRLLGLVSGRDGGRLDARLAAVAVLRAAGGLSEAPLLPEAAQGRARAALEGERVLLVVHGPRGCGKRLLVEHAAGQLGRGLLLLDAAALASLSREEGRRAVAALVREAVLLDAVPMIPDLDEQCDGDDREGRSEVRLPAFARMLLTEHPGPVAFSFFRERLPALEARPAVHIVLEPPGLTERAALFRRHAPQLAAAEAEQLASRYATTGGVIALAACAARAARSREAGAPDAAALDEAVRAQIHNRLGRLGRRLEAAFSYDDLVLDEEVVDSLREIEVCMRSRSLVRERWGLRGAPGVSVLFSGVPGVGKTLSATVLARQLGLSIYEIDLSAVVSKWLGETEKNLAEVFEAAEPGHAVLLFNEADSLFGKRTSDPKGANDRYANLEINYLLQRLERFGGLAILTTNLSMAIDPAFRRRFQYDVRFSFPSAELRARLWRRLIPVEADGDMLDCERLGARFELSGGFVKIAAERAAYAAAGAGQPLTSEIIVQTVERMYRERGKLNATGPLE